jgi:hypothetical protein
LAAIKSNLREESKKFTISDELFLLPAFFELQQMDKSWGLN